MQTVQQRDKPKTIKDMRHTAKSLIIAIALLLPVKAMSQVTIEQCLEAARNNYPQIKQLGLVEESEGYDLKRISRSWLPQLKISGKATYQSEVVEMPFEIPGYDFNLPLDQYSLVGEITQTIWDGGMSKSQKLSARTESEVKKQQIEVSVYSINQRVQNIYLGILLSDQQLEQNRILKENLQRNIEEVNTRIENGIASRSDRDIIEVNLLNCTQQEAEIISTRESYLKMLGQFTGFDTDTIELVMPEFNEAELQNITIRRPELSLYDAQLAQNEAMKKQIDAKISPTFSLSLQGGIGRPGLNMLKNELSPYYVAGLRMNWDIGALYTRKDELRKNDASRRQIESDKETFLFNTSVSVTEQMNAINKAEEMLSRDKEIIRLRESIRNSGEDQYRNGTITMTELMDRIDDEFDAKTAENIHKIQLLMAYYDLKNVIGY